MRKSIGNRIKVTKTGKFLRRKMGQVHFRAKKTGKQMRGKKGSLLVDTVDFNMFRKYVHHS